MKFKLLFNFLIIISLLFFIFSCDRENKLISANDVQTVQDDVTSESIYGEIFNKVDNIAKTKDDEIFNGTKSVNTDTCKVVTVELENGKIIFSNGDIITRTFTRIREWTSGDEIHLFIVETMNAKSRE